MTSTARSVTAAPGGPVGELVEQIRSVAALPLGRATSLPPAAYHSPELFDLEVEHVFRPGWIPLCRIDHVAKPGDYLTVDLLGEALVVTRDRDGQVHVLSRICRHRSMELVNGSGHAAALQCPYHLWTFSLTGSLVGAPHMQGNEAFDRDACSLPAFRHEEWGGFVFVNLDGTAEPLAPQLAPLERQLGDIDLADQRVIATIDWGEADWDWKVMVENYMECYHHIGAHRTTAQDLMPGERTWTDEGNEAYVLMHVPIDQESPAAQGAFGDQTLAAGEGLVIQLFPLTLFGPTPPGMVTLRVFPVAAGRVRLISDNTLPSAMADDPDLAAERQEAVKWFTEVHLEDVVVCQSVQQMTASPSARPGPLSPLEEPLWRFYQYLGRRLNSV